MPKDGKYSYKMTQLTQSIWIACINVEFGMWLLFKVTPPSTAALGTTIVVLFDSHCSPCGSFFIVNLT